MLPFKEGSKPYKRIANLQATAKNKTPTGTWTSLHPGDIGPHFTVLDFDILSQDAFDRLTNVKDADLLAWFQAAGLLTANQAPWKFHGTDLMGPKATAVTFDAPANTDITAVRAKVYAAAGSAPDLEEKNGNFQVMKNQGGNAVARVNNLWFGRDNIKWHATYAKNTDPGFKKAEAEAHKLGSDLDVQVTDLGGTVVFQVGK
jgi:hypothetical protein